MPRTLAVALLLVLGGTGAARAQAAAPDSATVRSARTLMEVTHAGDNFIAAFEKALESESNEAAAQLPPAFMDRFKAAVRAELPRLVEELAQVHARNYTREELEGFIRFFRTPLGQQYAAKQAVVGVESSTIGQRWGASIAMRVMSEMIERGEMPAPSAH